MSQEPIHVLVSARLTDEQIRALASVSPRLVIHAAPGGIALMPPNETDAMEITYPQMHPEIDVDELLRQAEVVIAYRVPDDIQQRAPRLRWVQFASAGIDHVWTEALAKSDLIVTTISGVHPIPMAEMVLSMMLIFVKQWPRLLAQQRAHRWDKFLMGELHGKTLGVVGLGKIGQEIARVGKCMGMNVIGVRRRQTGEPLSYVDKVFTQEALRQAIAMCDFVVVAVPLWAGSRGLFGEAEFRAMKPTAYFINVGRGATVDEAALIRALQEGWIAGAGLDVFAREPLPPDSPLWDMPNVIISPHMGADTDRYMERATAIFCENLRRYVAGEPLMNVVDHATGY